MTLTALSTAVARPASSSWMKSPASERRASGSPSCTPNQPEECWSNSQIIRVSALTSGRRPRIAAEIANGGDIDVLDVPPIAWPSDRVESRLPGKIPSFELDADVATSFSPWRLGDDAGGVMREIANQNDLAFFHTGTLHCLTDGSVLGSPHSRHRLQIVRFDRSQELLGSELGLRRAGELSVVARAGGTRARGQKE